MEQPFDPKSYCETLLAFMKNAPLTLFFKDTQCRYQALQHGVWG